MAMTFNPQRLGSHLKYLWYSFSIAFALFIGLNVLVGFIYHIKDLKNETRRGALKYGEEVARQTYPHLTLEEIKVLLNESWLLNYEYSPYREYSLSSTEGIYVNIDKAGFRYVENQAAWPPKLHNFNIFIFGGSTTFGAGIADGDTFSSSIQRLLIAQHPKVAVYNFGVPGYYSTHERILFEQLLLKKYVPSMAIFFDGLNDLAISMAEDSNTTKQIKEKIGVLTNAQEIVENLKVVRSDLQDIARRLPFQRIVKSIQYRTKTSPAAESMSDKERRQRAEQTIYQMYTNWNMIAAIASTTDVTSLFVLQPVPYYQQRIGGDTFPLQNGEKFQILAESYKIINEGPPVSPKNFLNLSQIQKNETTELYVDGVHYNRYFNIKIAENIVSFIQDKNLLTR